MKTTPKKSCRSLKSATSPAAGRGNLIAALPARHCGSLKPASASTLPANLAKAAAALIVALTLANARALTVSGSSNPANDPAVKPATAAPAASTAAPTAPVSKAGTPPSSRNNLAPADLNHSSIPPVSFEEDIRDIRSPRHVRNPWLWASGAAGALALAVGAFGVWLWFRRSRLLVKLPYEIALDQLEEARRYLTPDHAREFCFAVSETIRGYIEQRYQVRAAHRTTEEFLHDLLDEKQVLLVSHRKSLADFLQHCDLAKFALWRFSVPEMEAMLASARTFVLNSAIGSLPQAALKETTALPKSPRIHLDPAAAVPVHASPKPA